MTSERSVFIYSFLPYPSSDTIFFGVVRIPVYRIVAVCTYPKLLQAAAKCLCGRLGCIVGEHHAADKQSRNAERVYQPEHVQIVCYAEIAAHLVFFDIERVDDHHYFRLLFQLEKHAEL